MELNAFEGSRSWLLAVMSRANETSKKETTVCPDDAANLIQFACCIIHGARGSQRRRMLPCCMYNGGNGRHKNATLTSALRIGENCEMTRLRRVVCIYTDD